MTPRTDMEAALEAILFVSAEPIPKERLLEIFEADERAEAAEALAAVIARYQADEGRGVLAEEVAGGLRLATRPDLGPWLRRFYEVRGSAKLSMAALETLAIVAYRQPITAPEIQELRNVNPSGVLRTLLERRLIKIAGRKPVVGNPMLYRTTKEFLVHFGLQNLKELPPLEELEEALGLAADEAGMDLGGSSGEIGAREGMPEDSEEAVLREALALEERMTEREENAVEVEP
ncbi:MAG TPA: SMC-Scp complex subunit ScpB [Thermoanaerobaculia bacterium]|nr:SMC-Scp complex subunit ScpB [Thermoanaerobaculia bacterium]